MTVPRIWATHALRPHRLEGDLVSNAPDFAAKVADVIGLDLHPLQHAAVVCVDEQTASQARDRKDPVLPLSPGRAERQGFASVRHGTRSLAAFNTQTGEGFGKAAARHTSAEFVEFLTDLVVNQPPGQQITGSPTTSQRTRPRGRSGSRPVPEGASARHPDVRAGSTRLTCGSPRSNAMSSPVASVPRCRSHANAPARYPARQHTTQAREVEVHRCLQANDSRINWHDPVATEGRTAPPPT